MKIYESHTYVNDSERKEPWYQLRVINQWNFKAKSICYNYAGSVLISFELTLNTKTGLNTWTSKLVETLTVDIKKELVKMGYELKQ